MQRKHGQKYEKVVADSGYESLATTAGSKKMGRPLSLSLTITNLVRSIPLRLRSAEWKTWATTNRMTALSARMADIWTMFQNILLTPKMVQSEKSLFTVVKTARIVLTVLSAARQKRRKEISVCWEFQKMRQQSYRNITTEEGKLLRCNRSIQAEGAFGQLKHNRSFKRFLTGGNIKVLAELLFLGLSQNIAHFVSKCNSSLQKQHLIQPKAYLKF